MQSLTPLAKLTPENAYIFRITHRRNLPWILRNGLWAPSAQMQDPDFVPIGIPELIDSRSQRLVPLPPGGTLADYVPFYFTPYSPMLLNIVTGRNVPRQSKADIVILVSSLHRVHSAGRSFVFTDRHANLDASSFSCALNDLPHMVPWSLLQARDFKKDPENPDKSERYQAEALVHEHVPTDALMGVVAYNREAAEEIRQHAAQSSLDLPVQERPKWFF